MKAALHYKPLSDTSLPSDAFGFEDVIIEARSHAAAFEVFYNNAQSELIR